MKHVVVKVILGKKICIYILETNNKDNHIFNAGRIRMRGTQPLVSNICKACQDIIIVLGIHQHLYEGKKSSLI